MLRSSTRSRACLALWSSCQNRARIAAWLKFCCTLCSRGVLHVSMTCFLVAAFCRSGWACWSSSQLVDCDTVDSACYWLLDSVFAVAEACHVHRGQVQLHRKQCSTSGCTFGLAPGSVTGCKDVWPSWPRCPSQLLSKTTAFSSNCFLAVSCSSGAARTSTSMSFPSVVTLTGLQ